MPVSKKRRKKQRRSRSSPALPKSTTPKKKKISKQQILLYIISGVMILSLAISFIVSGSGGRTGVQNNPDVQSQTSDGNNLLTDPPAADATDTQNIEGEAEDNSVSDDTSEPVTDN